MDLLSCSPRGQKYKMHPVRIKSKCWQGCLPSRYNPCSCLFQLLEATHTLWLMAPFNQILLMMSFLWLYLFCLLLPLILHVLDILSCLISRTFPNSQDLYTLATVKSSLEKWKSPRNHVYILSVKGVSMKKPNFWSPSVIKLSCWQILALHPELDPKILFRNSEPGLWQTCRCLYKLCLHSLTLREPGV